MRRIVSSGAPGSTPPGVRTTMTTSVRAAVLSDPGRERDLNEDSVLMVDFSGGGLFAVADGMGGHAAGEVASRLALDELRAAYTYGSGPAPRRLAQAVQAANLAVYRQAVGHEAGMGTTLTAVLVDGGAAIVANVGDSRAYLYRQGALTRLSRDHSWVAEQVRLGFLTEQEARDHQWRNVVSNGLGSDEKVRLDLLGVRLEAGDRVLVCSDGLTGVVEDDDLITLLGQDAQPQDLVVRLVDTANERGGPDNITVVVVDVLQNGPKPRYALPTLNPAGPVSITTFDTPRRGGLLSYLTLAVLYLTLFGMIVVPTWRTLIAALGVTALALLLAFVVVRRLRARPPAPREATYEVAPGRADLPATPRERPE
ncbi:PP2C family protein-serine/threonine phosphatase [Deinococcus pimensis]|uniref:PP2C family protein-serine/threonine phosphatase n=1 Tax=Deinococcus pimensis TaxID=309888 RepID=UPI000694CEBA|nr:PP2C family serine/threonine-protein phosphatase [Deinococcus pimensis]